MRPLICLALALLTASAAFAQRPHDMRMKPESDPSSNNSYGKNIISFAPLQMTDVSPAGIGLCYERVLDQNYRFSFYLPIAISFNRNSDYNPNTGMREKHNNTFVYFYPGLKITPFGSDRVFSYSVGPSLAIGFGKENYYDYVYNPYTGTYENQYHNEQISRFGFLINNGLNVQITPHFYMGTELGLGIRYFDSSDYYDDFEPMVQFNFKLGYRF